tara:strand:- start:1506 stop:1841 length:336 start_codon:yes stop_codon:yes gene_type:complete
MVKKILNKKQYLNSLIIRIEQLDKQRKDISKAIANSKKDAIKLLGKKVSHTFDNQLEKIVLQIVKTTDYVLDIQKLKDANIYEKYKTKERNTTKFHITRETLDVTSKKRKA